MVAALIVLDGEKYLDGSEVCRLLGVKAATLYAYVSRGILKSYKQGIKRQRLYKQTEVEALLQLRPGDAPPPDSSKEKAESEVKPKRTEIPYAEDWIPYY